MARLGSTFERPLAIHGTRRQGSLLTDWRVPSCLCLHLGAPLTPKYNRFVQLLSLGFWSTLELFAVVIEGRS